MFKRQEGTELIMVDIRTRKQGTSQSDEKARRMWLPYMILVAAAVIVVVIANGLFDGNEGLKADAGDDFSVAVGASPKFDGCASEGDIVNYRWVILQAPAGKADDVGKPLKEISAACAFSGENAMLIDEIGSWVIELTVADADGACSSDRLQVEVTG